MAFLRDNPDIPPPPPLPPPPPPSSICYLLVIGWRIMVYPLAMAYWNWCNDPLLPAMILLLLLNCRSSRELPISWNDFYWLLLLFVPTRLSLFFCVRCCSSGDMMLWSIGRKNYCNCGLFKLETFITMFVEDLELFRAYLLRY